MTLIAIATPHRRHDALIQRLSDQQGLTVLHLSDRADMTAEKLAAFDPEWVFCLHWSHIVPRSVHQAFKVVIFHMTDLPYGRGGSPLQNLIVRGHTDTKLSAIVCEDGLDTGAIYLQHDLSLEGTAEEIFERATGLMEEMIQTFLASPIEARPQQGEPTLLKRRTPEQSRIEPSWSPKQLYDHIRMLDADGYPHAFVETDDLRITFRAARLSQDGTVRADATFRPRPKP